MTTTEPRVQEGGWSRRLHPRVALIVVVIVGLLLGDGLALLVHGAGGYFAFSPGTAPTITTSSQCQGPNGGDLSLPNGTPCARLVVPEHLTHDISGALYMVDVYVGPATPLDYFLKTVHLLGSVRSGTELVPKRDVLGSTPQSQLGCQDVQQMQGSTSSAAVVAVRHLGYTVTESDLGAQLYQVQPGSPAAKAGLECADVVTAINSVAVHKSQDLVAAIGALKPGERVSVTANRPDGKGTPRPVTLTATVGSTPALRGQPARPDKAFLGVVAQDDTTYNFPFGVTVEVGNIGGPSAGLALTLALIDSLSDGHLTGGLRVAATGTISVDGSVGDVGGVAQKAVAVRRAGAQVFLVPPSELRAARSQAKGMKVFAVSTLQQALEVLKSLGGHVPVAPTGQNGPG